jgi:hypothetical protein
MLRFFNPSFRFLAVGDPSIYITSHTHRWVPVKFDLFAGEELVNLLQSEIACLWVEEVDEREEAEVENYRKNISETVRCQMWESGYVPAK